jgi:hypothetical protein
MSEVEARRRDEEMELHEVLPDTCQDCGCGIFYAKDEPEIVWEPGRAWDEDCRNKECHCHTQAVIGRRRDRESVNPLDR